MMRMIEAGMLSPPPSSRRRLTKRVAVEPAEVAAWSCGAAGPSCRFAKRTAQRGREIGNEMPPAHTWWLELTLSKHANANCTAGRPAKFGQHKVFFPG